MARITEYPEASAPDDNEVVLLDGAEGSKKITIENLFKPLKTAFQAGVDLIYDAIVAKGVTPSSSTPEALAEGIDNACYLKYKEGQSTGREEVGVAHMVSLAGSIASGNRVTISADPGYYYMIGTSNGTGSTISTNTLDVISGATKVFCAYINRSSPLSTMGLVKATDSSIVFQVPTNSAYLIYKLGPCE